MSGVLTRRSIEKESLISKTAESAKGEKFFAACFEVLDGQRCWATYTGCALVVLIIDDTQVTPQSYETVRRDRRPVSGATRSAKTINGRVLYRYTDHFGSGFAMSTSAGRLGHVPGAKVIAYYADADGQFSTNKVGYDVDLFDEAVRNIAFGELRTKQDEPKVDHLEKLDELSITESGVAAPEDVPVQIKKEDVQFIQVAEKALKQAKGSLEDALLHLVHQSDLK
ncbi:hypothetical protein PSTT_08957 [Puccinia striiformis]|uniref:Uncharacterized protein n=1 Tax=Puccinia striiformis TaxID=27350 RepID=A0A2S4VA91_9BASI|nr:hypothetical protein PSTT_08957 [Puccinia striiformis]